MNKLHRHNPLTWIETVWQSKDYIPYDTMTEEQWDDFMTALNWITEDLGFEWDTEPNSPTNGELVRI